MKEYDRIIAEDWVSEEWGDRRQELVFIGSKLNEAEIRAAWTLACALHMKWRFTEHKLEIFWKLPFHLRRADHRCLMSVEWITLISRT